MTCPLLSVSDHMSVQRVLVEVDVDSPVKLGMVTSTKSTYLTKVILVVLATVVVASIKLIVLLDVGLFAVLALRDIGQLIFLRFVVNHQLVSLRTMDQRFKHY